MTGQPQTASPRTEAPDEVVVESVGGALENGDVTQWLIAAAIIVASVALSRVAKALVKRVLGSRSTGRGPDALLSDLIGRFVSYAIVAFGTVYALEELGVAIGPLLGALGIIGLAVAFALQSVLEDFVAGVILQVRRPFVRGDEIESIEVTGTLMSIDARTMTVETPDGKMVRLPNSEVVDAPITNLTEKGRRRSTFEVGVAYGTDIRRACEVIASAIEIDEVLSSPEPRVFATGFGPSSLDISVLFWHGPSIREEWEANHAVMVAVDEALFAASIEIPFPQRTLHFARTDDES